jgi:hypothetical protein
MTPSKIEPVTFRLLAQCLTHMRHRVSPVQTEIHIRVGTCKMYLQRTGRHSPSTHHSLVTATQGKSKESFGTGLYFTTSHVTNKYYTTNVAALYYFLCHVSSCGARGS